MSWPNSLWVIMLCLLKTLSALSTGTCRAFLSIRHRISNLFWEKRREPGRRWEASVTLRLHRATCRLPSYWLKSDLQWFGLAVLFPEALEAFGDLPLKHQAGPTLFSLWDLVRSQPAAMWLRDTHSHAGTMHGSPKKERSWSANTHPGNVD